ncbi:MAG: CoA-binding protein [Candidatus Caenarcaniphilales bacterium]|jgi:hypothetical protein|nr:CoA-binding protein [Candidatus Caenarcaniphilales bacterium]
MLSKVIVLGASDKAERYSYQAVELLKSKGYTVIPIHPKLKEILGITVLPDLGSIKDTDIDTLSVYINPELSKPLFEEILAIKPRRVIFNPNTENPELAQKLKASGIEVLEACTLVLIRTGQF